MHLLQIVEGLNGGRQAASGGSYRARARSMAMLWKTRLGDLNARNRANARNRTEPRSRKGRPSSPEMLFGMVRWQDVKRKKLRCRSQLFRTGPEHPFGS